jgi:hypothetical protein
MLAVQFKSPQAEVPIRHLLNYSDLIIMHFLLTQALLASAVTGSLILSNSIETSLTKRLDVTCGVAGDAT